ncbi:MAG: ribosome biogenesis GTPase Der [Deltaproteobacteria bacterium]|nr:ribosome biogenesis GTPase Der [Deltaproteobacteria bacterium]
MVLPFYAIFRSKTTHDPQACAKTCIARIGGVEARAMSQKPLLAIVGRPNVGKSTLFNRLVGRRQALVHDEPGVTRDRLYGTCEWCGHEWLVVDTGGIVTGGDSLADRVTEQSLHAVAEADAILCLFDGREGPVPLDETVVALVRKSAVPVFYIVNKLEAGEEGLHDFARFGVQPLQAISAEHGRGVDDLLDAIIAHVPAPVDPTTPDASVLQIAIIGRPNAGKSTLVNTLCGEARVVAHEQPGTTRDVIDVAIERNGARYTLLDTAGIRRKNRTDAALEIYSVMKSLRSMERANVIVIMTDVTEGLTHQDRSLVATAHASGRPTLVVLNKWDLARPRGIERETALEAAHEVLGELGRVPVLLLSAKVGDGTEALWLAIQHYGAAAQRRLTTSTVNQLIEEAQRNHHLPSYRDHHVKLYYGTQIGVAPPRLALFTNFPEGIPEAYQRYLLKHFETAFDAPGLPIRLQFRKK